MFEKKPRARSVRVLHHQKIRAYRMLYEFTKSQCSDCALTDCACKDSICAHVEAQARVSGVELAPADSGRPVTDLRPRLRFLGCHGCVAPPHLRETCTIYLCEPAQRKPAFQREKYDRLKDICARIELKLMQIEAADYQFLIAEDQRQPLKEV